MRMGLILSACGDPVRLRILLVAFKRPVFTVESDDFQGNERCGLKRTLKQLAG
jgi:hypothetical protein